MRGTLSWLGDCAMAWRSPFARQFYAAVFLWAFLVVVAEPLADRATGSARLAVALTPVLPAAWAMWALVRYLAQQDELERRKYVEALVFAFTVTFLIVSVGAQLETVERARLNAHMIVTVMLVSWSVGYGVAAWRYR